MPSIELAQRIRQEIEQIPLVDTHEHIVPETERGKSAQDFSYLFPHYASSDLVSAGMPPALMEAVRLPARRLRQELSASLKSVRPMEAPLREGMTLEEKWEAIEPYWEAIRNTAYARCILIAARDLFGVEDINRRTYQRLSEAIAASNQPGWYRKVLKEKAGIEVSIEDYGTTQVDRTFFAPVVRLDNFVAVRTREELKALERDTKRAIHSLSDLVGAMEGTLKGYIATGAVGVKTGLAYRRVLRYDKVAQHDAERVFNSIARHLGEGPSWEEAKPLQDYMFHQVVRQAIDAGLPIQIHTGLQEGNENIITNSNPTHLVNLFIEYREAKFDIFHGGYPYGSELATLAKNFPGVHIDMCWLHVISPSVAARMLHEWIETVPGNKIFAFGGDYIIAEGAYGHSRIARKVVARVLTEKVEEGYFSEDEAVALGRRLLHDNAKSLFKL